MPSAWRARPSMRPRPMLRIVWSPAGASATTRAIGHKLARCRPRSRQPNRLVYYGAWRVDQNTLDAATAARVKLIASETAVAVGEQAIRIHGGAGIMREYPVGRIHRDALVYVIGEGTSEIEKEHHRARTRLQALRDRASFTTSKKRDDRLVSCYWPVPERLANSPSSLLRIVFS